MIETTTMKPNNWTDAMNVPGLVAHQSALQGGAQLEVPRLDRRQG
jgi:hypothetical protein